MFTKEQLDNWFTYHAPTVVTGPKYTEIRLAETAAVDAMYTADATFDSINAAFRRFADVINTHAPDSADKIASIRCVRLARNAANEAIA